jgi:hypothetical protein
LGDPISLVSRRRADRVGNVLIAFREVDLHLRARTGSTELHVEVGIPVDLILVGPSIVWLDGFEVIDLAVRFLSIARPGAFGGTYTSLLPPPPKIATMTPTITAMTTAAQIKVQKPDHTIPAPRRRRSTHDDDGLEATSAAVGSLVPTAVAGLFV